jgi:hypothetical protein
MIRNIVILAVGVILLYSCSKDEKICRKDPNATSVYDGNVSEFHYSNDTLMSDTAILETVEITCVNGGVKFSTQFGIREFEQNLDSSYYESISTDSIYNIQEVYQIFEDRSMSYDVTYTEKNGPTRIEYSYIGVRQAN